MDINPQTIANGGFTLVCLIGLVMFLKWLLWGSDSGLNRVIEGWQKIAAGTEKIGSSVENLNNYMVKTMDRQEAVLADNAVNMGKQERAGLAYCDFLRHRLQHEELEESAKSELLKKIDDIEKGLME